MHLVAWQARISEITSFVLVLLNVDDEDELEEAEEAAEEADDTDLLELISLVIEALLDFEFPFKSKKFFPNLFKNYLFPI